MLYGVSVVSPNQLCEIQRCIICDEREAVCDVSRSDVPIVPPELKPSLKSLTLNFKTPGPNVDHYGIPEDMFARFKDLVNLSISGGVDYIKSAFKNLSELRTLSITNTRAHILSGVLFIRLKKLEILNLQENKLISTPFYLPKISSLDVSYNKLDFCSSDNLASLGKALATEK